MFHSSVRAEGQSCWPFQGVTLVFSPRFGFKLIFIFKEIKFSNFFVNSRSGKYPNFAEQLVTDISY